MSTFRRSRTRDFLHPGTTVDLVLVVVNQSPDVTDKLVGISTDIGKVTVTGDPDFAGRWNAVRRYAERSEPESRRRRRGRRHRQGDGALTKPITNGLNYNFTFDFEKAGSVSLPVPISAGRPAEATSRRRPEPYPRSVGPARYGHRVAKARSQYRCSECRHVTAKWVGRCLECGTWGSVDEVAVLSAVRNGNRHLGAAPSSAAVPISSIEPRRHPALSYRDR